MPAEYQGLAYEGAVPFDPNESPAATNQRNESMRDASEGNSRDSRMGEWRELHERTKHALQPFGKDDEAGGDYFVIDLFPNEKVQMVELHRLHMLRPEVIKSLQNALVGFPDWRIEICAICPEEKTIVDVESGLVLYHDKIFDALDRASLPPKYCFIYEGSRRPPGGFNL